MIRIDARLLRHLLFVIAVVGDQVMRPGNADLRIGASAQLARHLDIDPEACLRDANRKFINRFKKVEDEVKSRGQKLGQTPQAELEKIWNEVKKK